MVAVLRVPSQRSTIRSALDWIVSTGATLDPAWTVLVEADAWAEASLPNLSQVRELPSGLAIGVIGAGAQTGRTRLLVREDAAPSSQQESPWMILRGPAGALTGRPVLMFQNFDFEFRQARPAVDEDGVGAPGYRWGFVLLGNCRLRLDHCTATTSFDPDLLSQPPARGVFVSNRADGLREYNLVGPDVIQRFARSELTLVCCRMSRCSMAVELVNDAWLRMERTAIEGCSAAGVSLAWAQNAAILDCYFRNNDIGLRQFKDERVAAEGFDVEHRVRDCSFVDNRIGVVLDAQFVFFGAAAGPGGEPLEPYSTARYLYDRCEFRAGARRLPPSTSYELGHDVDDANDGAVGLRASWRPMMIWDSTSPPVSAVLPMLAVSNCVFHFLDTGLSIDPGTSSPSPVLKGASLGVGGLSWVDHCTFVENQLRAVLIAGGPADWAPVPGYPPYLFGVLAPRFLLSNSILIGDPSVRAVSSSDQTGPYLLHGGVELWDGQLFPEYYFEIDPESTSASAPAVILIGRNLFHGFYFESSQLPVPTGSPDQAAFGQRVFFRDAAGHVEDRFVQLGDHQHAGTPWFNKGFVDGSLTWADLYQLGNDPGFPIFSSPALLPAVYYVPSGQSDAVGASLPAGMFQGGGVMRRWGFYYGYLRPTAGLSLGLPPDMYADAEGWPKYDYWGRERVPWPGASDNPLRAPTLGAAAPPEPP